MKKIIALTVVVFVVAVSIYVLYQRSQEIPDEISGIAISPLHEELYELSFEVLTREEERFYCFLILPKEMKTEKRGAIRSELLRHIESKKPITLFGKKINNTFIVKYWL